MHTKSRYRVHTGENIILPKLLIGDSKIMNITAFLTSCLILMEILLPKASFNSDYIYEFILPKLRDIAYAKLKIRTNFWIPTHINNPKNHNSKNNTLYFKDLKKLHIYASEAFTYIYIYI